MNQPIVDNLTQEGIKRDEHLREAEIERILSEAEERERLAAKMDEEDNVAIRRR